MKAALSAQINKIDRNDARGIAQMIRFGLFRPVHTKTERSQEIRMLLTPCTFLQSTIIDIKNDLLGLLRNFGMKFGANIGNCVRRCNGLPLKIVCVSCS